MTIGPIGEVPKEVAEAARTLEKETPFSCDELKTALVAFARCGAALEEVGRGLAKVAAQCGVSFQELADNVATVRWHPWPDDMPDLVPDGWPTPDRRHDHDYWLIASDWWEEHGDESRSARCKQWASQVSAAANANAMHVKHRATRIFRDALDQLVYIGESTREAADLMAEDLFALAPRITLRRSLNEKVMVPVEPPPSPPRLHRVQHRK